MTGLADLLPDFSETPSGGAPTEGPGTRAADLEARETAAYEQGYRAGWDDAVAAQAEDGTRLSDDIAQSLRDLSFTYHEAYTHVLRAMAPLLEEIVEKILPPALEDGFAAHVVSELNARSERLGGMNVTLAVAPERLALVEPLIARDVGFPVTLVPDSALGDGQADIRLADGEDRIDLTEIAEGIRTAIAGLQQMDEGQFAHAHG